jgi:hypothetical protein
MVTNCNSKLMVLDMPLVCKSPGIDDLETMLTISADVLSTVQSSMSAGQDASQTLSRLMDWAEAREVSHPLGGLCTEEPSCNRIHTD